MLPFFSLFFILFFFKGMDDMDRVLQPHISTGSPASKQFKSPLTPMSNPATPTSPASKMVVSATSGRFIAPFFD